MRKTIFFAFLGVSLALAGCVQQTPTKDQNSNQPTANINQNVNQPVVNQNQNLNANQPVANVNQNQNTNQSSNYPKNLVTDKSCKFIQMYSYCSNDEYCFPLIDKCVKWNSDFKSFIEERTKSNPLFSSGFSGNCNKPCSVCESGKYTKFEFDNTEEGPSQIPYPASEGIKELKVCFECYDSLADKGYGCIQGYECVLGKCIKK